MEPWVEVLSHKSEDLSLSSRNHTRKAGHGGMYLNPSTWEIEMVESQGLAGQPG